ncbi:MAG: DUF2730 family protein [Caulobacter sp.]|nr:DUF2730 family protein [Caulobacter sp.]
MERAGQGLVRPAGRCGPGGHRPGAGRPRGLPRAGSPAAVSEALPYLSLAVAVVAVAIAGLVALRNGRWRETDAAKEMADDIESLGTRVTSLESGMKNVATRADVAKLTAELRGLEKTAALTQAGVTRIEGHLMRAAS